MLTDARAADYPDVTVADSTPESPEIVRRACSHEITSKMNGHGGARPNSGGLRSPPGGRPHKPVVTISARALTGPRWYAVEAEPRSIHTACRTIIDKGFDAFLPTVAVSVQGKTRRLTVHRPMFYQWLFTRFDADNDEWRTIRGSEELPNGIKRLLLTTSQRPIPVERGLVERLIETANDRLNLPPDAMPAMKADEAVLIKAGAMEGHVGHVVECDGIMTKLRVTVFARPCEVLVRRCDVVAE